MMTPIELAFGRNLLQNLKSDLRSGVKPFTDAIHHASDAIVLMDDCGYVQIANRAAEYLLDLPAAQIVGLLFGIPLVNLEKAELDIVHRDGTSLVAEMWQAEIELNHRKAYLVTLRDITQQRRAEDALRESEERYRMISGLITDFAFSIRIDNNSQATVDWVVGRFEQQLGFSLTGLIAAGGWQNIVHPDDRAQVEQVVQAILSGQPMDSELRLLGNDKQQYWIHQRSHPVIDSISQNVSRVYVVIQDITERKRAALAVVENEQRFRSLAINSPDTILIINSHTSQTVFCNRDTVFGFPAGKFTDANQLFAAVHPADEEFARSQWAQILQGAQPPPIEYRIQNANAQWEWAQQRATILSSASDLTPSEILLTISLITQRKRDEETLHQANETLSFWVNELKQRNQQIMLLNEMGELLQSCVSIDEAYNVVAKYSRRLFPNLSCALYKISASRHIAEAVAHWGNFTPNDLVLAPDSCWALRRGRVHLVTDPQQGLCCTHISPADTGAIEPYLCIPLTAQGETFGMLHLRGPLQTANPDRWELLATSMAEQIALALANLKLQETLRLQAIRDPLTSLFNRRYMEETLEREIRRSARHQRELGIIMLDIDHFKTFNDQFGHDAGDKLLQAMGNFLSQSVRGEDIACRFGGDEFIIILPETPEDTTQNRAENLRQEAKSLTALSNGQILGAISISLGVSSFPKHGATAEKIVKSADAALYRAKRDGRDRWRSAPSQDD